MFRSAQKKDDDIMMPKAKKKENEEVSIATCLKRIDHRFSMHISTDKHKYRPGETVHIRGVLLNEFDHTPATKKFLGESFNIRIVGPSGDVVLGGDEVNTPPHQHSVISLDWKIPEGQAGGSYKVEIGKQYYEKKESLEEERERRVEIDPEFEDEKEDGKDGKKKEEEEEEKGNGLDWKPHPDSEKNVEMDGGRITKTSKAKSWNCLVRAKINEDVTVAEMKVEKTNKDKSGIFFGVMPENFKARDVHRSENISSFGYPDVGDTWKLEYSKNRNELKVWKNGVYQGITTQGRIKRFPSNRDIYFCVFLFHHENTVRVASGGGRAFFPMASRKFDVQSYRTPQFKMNMEFGRKGYGPGDAVKAILKVERSEGGFPKCEIVATARVDGEECFRKTYSNSVGTQLIQFTLPKEITDGNGSLHCSVTEGVTESTSLTIPILLKKLDCAIYPEGGELVYGIQGGVYVEAKTLYGDPADFEGTLIEKEGEKEQEICNVKTMHEGRGKFEFTPKTGCSYEIRVFRPSAITEPIPIEGIKEDGLTIRLPMKKSVEFGQMIDVVLSSSQNIEVKLGLFKKNKQITMSDVVKIQRGKDLLFQMDPKDCDGVLRLTAFYINTQFGVVDLAYPIAERLIMVKPKKVLTFNLETDKKKYVPGDTVKLTVKPSIDGKPVDCVVCCTVTDDTVVQSQEKRKRGPRLIEQVYLENEVKELKDVTAYMKKEVDNVEDPDECCDLLLGCQGWRRFVYKYINKKAEKFWTMKRYEGTKKEFFFRFLNLPNPEYFERWEAAQKKMKDEMEKIVNFEDSYQAKPTYFGRPSYGRGRGGGRPMMRSGIKYKKKKSKGASPRLFDSAIGAVKKEKEEKKKMPARPSKMNQRLPFLEKKDSIAMPKEIASELGMSLSESPKRKMEKEEYVMEDSDSESEDEEEESVNFSFERAPPQKKLLSSLSRRSRRRPYYDSKPIPLPPSLPLLKVIEYAVEYAHQTSKKDSAGERNDFTETVFFSPYRVVEAKNKKGVEMQFDLSDSVTSFVVKIDGFSLGGAVGSSNEMKIVSQKPFFIVPKLPVEMSSADNVIVPVGIMNNLPIATKCSVTCSTEDEKVLKFENNSTFKGKIKANERKVEYFDLKAQSVYISTKKKKGQKADNVQSVTIRGDLPDFRMNDTVTKSIKIQPYGFISCFPFSGLLKKNSKSDTFDFEMPNDSTLVPGSIRAVGYVSPSNAGGLISSANGLIREPWGCFEQTASCLYPLIMAKQLLLDLGEKLDPRFEQYLKLGYKKVMGYEIKRTGGFDWYGRAPANEALSAMGLAMLVEMKKVFKVEPGVFKRTRDWLLSRKMQTKFKSNPGKYAYGYARENTTSAYICWSLSKVGVSFDDLSSILIHLKEKGTKMGNQLDHYITALLSIAYHNFGYDADAQNFATMLADEQAKDGTLNNAADTITRSCGRNRTLECTALAVLAWMNYPEEYADEIEKGMKFILENSKNGRFGTTQSTVLCLQAIIKYFDGDAPDEGGVELLVNGKAHSKISIAKNSQKPIHFDDFSSEVKVGEKNKIQLRSEYKNRIPFSLAIWYKVNVPPQEQNDLPFTFATKIKDAVVQEGDSTDIEVTLEVKKIEEALPMMVAVVSVPSGLTPRMERLKELQKLEKFAYFEMFGARNVVFYWRGAQPGEKINFSFDCAAEIPGDYIGDASRAYVYYDDDERFYVEGLKVKINKKTN